LKLLFDANLSPKLVARLADLFPDSTHVFHTDLEWFTTDQVIWNYALANGYAIVTADADFLRLAATLGPATTGYPIGELQLRDSGCRGTSASKCDSDFGSRPVRSSDPDHPKRSVIVTTLS